MPAQTTPAQANLFLLDDLEDVGRTRALPEGDLDALRAVARVDQGFRGHPSQGSRPRWDPRVLALRAWVPGT